MQIGLQILKYKQANRAKFGGRRMKVVVTPIDPTVTVEVAPDR